jgi:hypothetical protein
VPRPLAQRRLYDAPKPLSTMHLVTGHDLRRAAEAANQPVLIATKPLPSSEGRHGSAPFHAPLPIRLWHLASLDAPTVAVVWSVAFAWTANVRLPWWVLILLPLGVWAVYIADRLLDARTGVQSPTLDGLRERHIFHWRHRRILAPMATASALAAAWIIFRRMPRTTQEHDSLLAAASLLYFTRVHSGRRFLSVLSKEFLVGVLFTFGCALFAFSRTHYSAESPWWPVLVTTILFALLAWFNCYAIDHWESRNANPSHSSVTAQALLLTAAFSISSALLTGSHPRSASLLACGAAAALLLIALHRVRSRLTPVTLRAAADLALLTPAVLVALWPLFRK